MTGHGGATTARSISTSTQCRHPARRLPAARPLPARAQASPQSHRISRLTDLARPSAASPIIASIQALIRGRASRMDALKVQRGSKAADEVRKILGDLDVGGALQAERLLFRLFYLSELG